MFQSIPQILVSLVVLAIFARELYIKRLAVPIYADSARTKNLKNRT